MCIIIYNSKGKLDPKVINEASLSNPDGAGIMYSVDDSLHIFKSRKNKRVIDEYYRIRKEYSEILIVLHFRISTDGGITDDNCHPYKVNNTTALVHNGILANYSNRKTAMSDTRLFIKDILCKFSNSILWSDPMLSLIRQALGFGNKIVMMRNDGESVILNEHLGHWDKEKINWFSNSSYKPTVQYALNAAWHDSVPYSTSNWTPTRAKKYQPEKGSVGTEDWDVESCDYCGKPVFSWYEREKRSCSICLSAMKHLEDEI